MKKVLFLVVCFLMLVGNTYAQKGKQAIGFGLSYGTEIESVGLGLKYQYNITNPIRLEPSLNYFFENNNVSMLDVNLNFHYLFPVASKVKLYPLLGLTFSNWMFDWNDDWDVDIHGNHVHIGGDDDSDNECQFGMRLYLISDLLIAFKLAIPVYSRRGRCVVMHDAPSLCVKNKGVYFDTPSDKSAVSLFPRNKD